MTFHLHRAHELKQKDATAIIYVNINTAGNVKEGSTVDTNLGTGHLIYDGWFGWLVSK